MKHYLSKFLMVFLAAWLVSCSMLGFNDPLGQTQGGAAKPLLILAAANSTPTPTPFQPIPPTPGYIPTDYPVVFEPSPTSPVPEEGNPEPTQTGVNPGGTRTWEDYPGPTVWPDIEIPAPMGILPQPADQVNILLLGSDQRPQTGGFRTDTILLLTLSPSLQVVSLTSFPRDLYVYIPGWTVQRINTAFGWGGFDALALTMDYNFGVHPDHYVLINFWSFVDVIDSLGGITVNVAYSLTDHRDGYGDYTVPSGLVNMDGETALWYVRSRYSSSDFDRGRRQQEVIQATFNRLMSLDALTRAPQLYQLYKQNVTTDMTFDQMSDFLPLASKLSDPSSIKHYYIGPRQVSAWTNTTGAQVLLPIQSAVLEVMRQALNSP
jgi:LCP family protein required for cell wall assembly